MAFLSNRREFFEFALFDRISVPRSTLQSPYRVKPHRRKSFDPTDTVSLSKVLYSPSFNTTVCFGILKF